MKKQPKLLTIVSPVVPIESEQRRLLNLLSSQRAKEYLATRTYKKDSQAVSAFYDGIAFASLIIGTSPNKLYGAQIAEDNLVKFTDRIDVNRD